MLETVLAVVMKRNSEPCTLCQYLGCLLLRDPLDLLQDSARCVCNRLNGIVAAIDDQLDVSLCKTSYSLFEALEQEVQTIRS
jgi:hypothetical protein